jgi:hypothetical protein
VNAHGQLLALYRELDAELADLQRGCRACGRCCDFSTHESVLYASRLEREVLTSGGRPPKPLRPEVCPYLLDGKCSARELRTLGCRTHYCEAAAAERGRELYEKYRARVAEISREHGIEWDYRPVLESGAHGSHTETQSSGDRGGGS